MNEKRITRSEMMAMDRHRFELLVAIAETGAWRLWGIWWQKRIEWFEDIATGDLVIRYE